MAKSDDTVIDKPSITDSDEKPDRDAPLVEIDEEAPDESDDLDAIALAEAKKELEAEENDAEEEGSEEEESDESTGEPGSKPDEEEEDSEGKQDDDQRQPINIPKARFDEVLSENATLKEQLAFEKGRNEALQQRPADTGGDPNSDQPSPVEQIEAIRAEQLALAQKYDDGEITTAEWKKQDLALSDREADIRRDATRRLQQQAASQQQPAQQDSAVDLYLDEKTTDLEAAHPYCAEIKSQDDWEFLTRKAMEELESEGIQLGTSARDTLIVRTRVAELTDRYGPALTGKTLEKPSETKPSGDKPGLSDVGAARKKKLEQAATSPPDTTKLGSHGDANTEYTDTDILNLTEEEFDALPISVKRRFDPSITG